MPVDEKGLRLVSMLVELKLAVVAVDDVLACANTCFASLFLFLVEKVHCVQAMRWRFCCAPLWICVRVCRLSLPRGDTVAAVEVVVLLLLVEVAAWVPLSTSVVVVSETVEVCSLWCCAR